MTNHVGLATKKIEFVDFGLEWGHQRQGEEEYAKEIDGHMEITLDQDYQVFNARQFRIESSPVSQKSMEKQSHTYARRLGKCQMSAELPSLITANLDRNPEFGQKFPQANLRCVDYITVVLRTLSL